MASIDTSYSTYYTSSATDTSSAASASTQTLDQDDFLKLLVTQMTSQDPMNPMTDTSFIAQMAQFTSLEQAKDTLAATTSMQAQMALLQANSMIGRQVSIEDSSGNTVTGIVQGVQVEEGTPQIIVNGQAYDLDQVFNITTATTE